MRTPQQQRLNAALRKIKQGQACLRTAEAANQSALRTIVGCEIREAYRLYGEAHEEVTLAIRDWDEGPTLTPEDAMAPIPDAELRDRSERAIRRQSERAHVKLPFIPTGWGGTGPTE